MTNVERIAVVTGANRGIGFAIVKRLCQVFDGKVYLTARDEGKGKAAVKELNKLGLHPNFHQLDVTDEMSRQRLAKHLKDTHGGLDVLVNNAGIGYQVNSKIPFVKHVEDTLNVNFYSVMHLCTFLFPLLRPHSRVVNISSSSGHLSRIPSDELKKEFAKETLTSKDVIGLLEKYKISVNNNDYEKKGWPSSAYVVSKVALTALTFIQQRELSADPRDDIVVNSVHPGYVDTEMNGHQGILTIEQGAESPVKLATLPKFAKSPVGEFVWCDMKIVDWKSSTAPYR